MNNLLDPFNSPDEDIIYLNERYENNEFSAMFAELNLPFTNEELAKSKGQLRTNKSPGPDKLINEFSISCKNLLNPTLLMLFNKLFAMGYFPEEWSGIMYRN